MTREKVKEVTFVPRQKVKKDVKDRGLMKRNANKRCLQEVRYMES